MNRAPFPIVRVTVTELRQIFNAGKFLERTAAGVLREEITHSGTPSPEIPLPVGTKSQIISYIDQDGVEVARAHRFLLPDGTIGASGRPDPKRVVHEGVMYRIIPQKK